jgi:hypothetical protein
MLFSPEFIEKKKKSKEWETRFACSHVTFLSAGSSVAMGHVTINPS